MAIERFCKGVLALAELREIDGVVRLASSIGFAGPYVWFCMELCEGDLSQTIRARRLDKANLLELYEQVLETVASAHRRNVRHRDVRPQNILLKRDRNGKTMAVLADFDIAFWEQLIFEDESTMMVEGNRRYLPEELLKMPSEHPRFKDFVRSPYIDVFALGVVLLDIVASPGLPLVERRTYDEFVAQLQVDVPELPIKKIAHFLSRAFQGYERAPRDAVELLEIWRSEPPPTQAEIDAVMRAKEAILTRERQQEQRSLEFRRRAFSVIATLLWLLIQVVLAYAALSRPPQYGGGAAAGTDVVDAGAGDGFPIQIDAGARVLDESIVSMSGPTEEAILGAILPPDMKKNDRFEAFAHQLFQLLPLKRDAMGRLTNRLGGVAYSAVSRLQEQLRIVAYGKDSARLDPALRCQYRVLFGHASVALLRCQEGLAAMVECLDVQGRSNLDVWVADVSRCLQTEDGYLAASASSSGGGVGDKARRRLAQVLLWVAGSNDGIAAERLSTWRALMMLEELRAPWGARRSEVYLRLAKSLRDCDARVGLSTMGAGRLPEAERAPFSAALSASRGNCDI